jgi:hypothetical protein
LFACEVGFGSECRSRYRINSVNLAKRETKRLGKVQNQRVQLVREKEWKKSQNSKNKRSGIT